MNFTKSFVEINKKDAVIAGGKGGSLGEMTQAGIPVPGGFIILSGAFDSFIQKDKLGEEIDAILKLVNYKSTHDTDQASKEIRYLIEKKDFPQDIADEIFTQFELLGARFVAVRSSATAEDGAEHAWAGQLESYLNTTRENLLESVKRCWSSLFTPRAIFYRFEKGLNGTAISVAVVVQKMVNSDAAGIAFSVHPLTRDPNQVLIEGSYGLGEAVVSGQVIPDAYVVAREPKAILSKKISTKERGMYRKPEGGSEWLPITEKKNTQVLSDEEILLLTDTLVKIEAHYGFPVDIEWAREANHLYIVQSRPITTLDAQSSGAVLSKDSYIAFTLHDGFAPYFFSWGFFTHVMDMGALVFYDGTVRKSFLKKDAVSRTLQEGLSLFSDKEWYESLKIEMDTTFKELQSSYLALGSNFSPTILEQFLDQATKLSTLYRYTEFFYTDTAYKHVDTNNVIRENFQTFEQFKLDGRQMINALTYTDGSYMRGLLELASKKFGVGVSDLEIYKAPEIFGLFNGVKIDQGVLRERRERYCIYVDQEGKSVETWGGVSEPLIDVFFVDHYKGEKIDGEIASPGVANGVARVVSILLDDFDSVSKVLQEIQPGEILVADSTIPEILPACEVAGGIITNQGGMMSHAAIVSREFKIPCLVGTQNATQRIKTGDKILLNATEGYARVIS